MLDSVDSAGTQQSLRKAVKTAGSGPTWEGLETSEFNDLDL